MSRDGLGGDRGAVAAEFAVAMTAIVVVVMLAIGALGAAARQVALQDAVADAARLAARSEPEARVIGAVSAVVPGAGVQIGRSDDLVCVTGTATTVGIDIRATGCALAGGW